MAATSLWPASFKITIFSIFLILSSAYYYPVTPKTQPLKKIYAFGDSFTDTGNTNYAPASFPPYGMTYPRYPDNRYSDGKLVIDFVAEALALPLLQPYLHPTVDPTITGINFAVAGSTAINFGVNHIGEQLGWFNQMLASKGCMGSASSSPQCHAAFEDALIWVGEIGANDYTRALQAGISIPTLAVSAATKFLTGILTKSPKYVVVQGLPPLGCLAASQTTGNIFDKDEYGCTKSANDASNMHNEMYKAAVANLRQQFPSTTIVWLDYWGAYLAILSNRTTYGLTEPFRACCTGCGTAFARACWNPEQFINWDGVHLTQAMYRPLADMFLNHGFSDPPFHQILATN